MNGLVFEEHSPVVASAPTRTDIACFVGFVRRRANAPLPPALSHWLGEQGWTSPPYARPIDELLDVPVPIDSWDAFDRLFQWESRPLDGGDKIATSYLGAAVRSFFAQGGRKCYVVRVDDPWQLITPRRERVREIAKLVPGFDLNPGSLFDGSPVDRASWHGIGHLFGLPDVSFLCLPDLADAVAVDRAPVEVVTLRAATEEEFVECSEREPAPPSDSAARRFRAPRCDDGGFADWTLAVGMIGQVVLRHLREVQFIAAVPIPERDSKAAKDLLAFMAKPANGPSPSSPFVQLAFPWARTAAAAGLPEQLESPDALLAGLLAGNALTRGTFRSGAHLPLAEVFDLHPLLRRDETNLPGPDAKSQTALVEHVSLFGSTPAGFRLLSDVTTSLNESYRPANVNRLVSVIVRAARQLGEEIVFENSGERIWERLRESLEILLGGLWQDGALRGATAAEAFQVRCDRTTMTQNDIDNGRVVVSVRFEAATPVEQITVVLAMDEGGQVSLVSSAAT
jgi:hypothetical protein